MAKNLMTAIQVNHYLLYVSLGFGIKFTGIVGKKIFFANSLPAQVAITLDFISFFTMVFLGAARFF